MISLKDRRSCFVICINIGSDIQRGQAITEYYGIRAETLTLPFFFLFLMTTGASPSGGSDDVTAKPSSFHPALTVSNIRTFIPINLGIEKVQYASWAELFKIHARATLTK